MLGTVTFLQPLPRRETAALDQRVDVPQDQILRDKNSQYTEGTTSFAPVHSPRQGWTTLPHATIEP